MVLVMARASRVLRRRAAVVAAIACVGVAVVAGRGWALDAPNGGVIHACASKKTGALRLGRACRRSEDAVSWNAAGPAGPAGPQGASGPQGLEGAAGAPGAHGLPGSQGLQGAQGVQGSRGVQGPLGLHGTTGPPGISSYQIVLGGGVVQPTDEQGAFDASVQPARRCLVAA